MDKRDYEWHYFIGGDCSLTRRKYGGTLARIHHIEQGIYEARILREHDPSKPWIVGMFTDSDKAQEIIHRALEPLWEAV